MCQITIHSLENAGVNRKSVYICEFGSVLRFHQIEDLMSSNVTLFMRLDFSKKTSMPWTYLSVVCVSFTVILFFDCLNTFNLDPSH